VFIGDPALPFVISHNEIRLKPRCYVRLPVRMVPVSLGQIYESVLCAQTASGKIIVSLRLSGQCEW
jgi:hypothetical protein